MSDFFTKKQKKYWCECCNVFIEYSKIVIEAHNRTSNHINNSTRSLKYLNQKRKFNNYVKNLNQKQDDYNLNEKILESKKEKKNENYLDELKLNELKNSNKKKWGVFFDKKYNLPYFFNFITNESVWEKPKDFDGTQEEIDKIILLNKIKEVEKEKNNNNNIEIKEGNEGIIGKWVKISKKEGNKIFGKNLEEFLIEKEKKLNKKKRKLEINKKKDVIEINKSTKELIMNQSGKNNEK